MRKIHFTNTIYPKQTKWYRYAIENMPPSLERCQLEETEGEDGFIHLVARAAGVGIDSCVAGAVLQRVATVVENVKFDRWSHVKIPTQEDRSSCHRSAH